MKNQNKTLTITLLAIGCLLLCYSIIRACILSITWDESYTYLEFVRKGIVLPTNSEIVSANNHPLNTFLIILFTKLLGFSTFIIRLPNILAHIIFIHFSARLVSHFEKYWIVVFSFLIINVNPYLLDFFSLARGYGLSLGFMMGSIYYLFIFIKYEYKIKYASFSLVFAFLAVLSNLVLLNYALVLFGIVFFTIVGSNYSNKLGLVINLKQVLLKLLAPILIFGILLYTVIPIALLLKTHDALYYGGKEGFLKDTVHSIVSSLLYNLSKPNWLIETISLSVLIVPLVAIVLVIYEYQKKKNRQESIFLALILSILLLSSLSTIVQFYLFKTPLLLNRTALFLYVLYVLCFVFSLHGLSKYNVGWKWLIFVIGFFSIIHLLSSLNLKYVNEWKFDAETNSMLDDVNKLRSKDSKREIISIGTPTLLEQSINYYRVTGNLNWLNGVSDNNKINLLNDFLYLDPESYSKLNSDSLEIIKKYPVTNNVLAHSKYKVVANKILFDSILDFAQLANKEFELNKETEFGPSITVSINQVLMENKFAKLEFKSEVIATDIKATDLMIVVSFQNKKECYSYQQAKCIDYIKHENESTTIQFTIMVPEEIEEGDEMKVYFWNPKKQQLTLKRMEVKWQQYTYAK
ncbi:MAG: hypothetical protein WCP52_05540 [Bacteroidota bacterium]